MGTWADLASLATVQSELQATPEDARSDAIHAGPMSTTLLPTIELVVSTNTGDDDLEIAVRRLHRHLVETFDGPWTMTLADDGSTEKRIATARALASSLPRVRIVALGERLDRKALRARFADSAADIVAFMTVDGGTDLEALLAPLRQHGAPATNGPTIVPTASLDAFTRRAMTRRTALVALGSAGMTALLAACGATAAVKGAVTSTASSDATTPSTSTSTSATTTASTNASPSSSATTAATTATTAAPTAAAPAAAVALAPELTEGPYYLDLNLVRGDLREDRVGAPFVLNLVVVDANGAPVSGAAVDIWHCDASGIYSGFTATSTGANGGGGAGGGQGGGSASSTDTSTFLRGTLLSDASGRLTFTTIYPGWYQGRTVHIHIKAHVRGKAIHTGQLFFDDTFTDGVYASVVPYSSRTARGTRNANDQIFGQGGSQSLLDVGAAGGGYAATMTMAVKTG